MNLLHLRNNYHPAFEVWSLTQAAKAGFLHLKEIGNPI